MEEARKQDRCQMAIRIARQGDLLNWELAELLSAIKAGEEWRDFGSKSFKQFLKDHVRIKESTARQIMKVRSLCDRHSIPREKMNELGWAKLAEISGAINEENKDAVLQDVQELTQAELRSKYRAKEEDAKSDAKTPQQSIQWTEEIEQALRHASRFTRSNDLQANLEFIAKSFTTMMPTAPEHDIRFSMN
jgi:hypothetical protein